MKLVLQHQMLEPVRPDVGCSHKVLHTETEAQIGYLRIPVRVFVELKLHTAVPPSNNIVLLKVAP